MRTGLVITTYNRPKYLERCLASLVNEVRGIRVYVIDDASTDPTVSGLILDFAGKAQTQVRVMRNPKNMGVAYSLKTAFEAAFNDGCEIVMNLDSDAIVKKGAIQTLAMMSHNNPHNLVTGFHSVNKNPDGKDRHKVISQHEGYWLKESVGGINFVLDQKLYGKYVKPALEKAIAGKCNWDHQACINSMEDGNGVICMVPSLIQHIGVESAMGHSKEAPDVAADFFELELPDVTLIGVDCNHVDELIKACDISTRHIKFGAVKMLTSMTVPIDGRIVKIKPLNSKEAYNEFIIRELYKHIDTKYLLIFQGDGYVLDYKAWSPDFLNYDYIGATWWYKDGRNVGNGGFSLRTKKFMEHVAKDPVIVNTYPEDHVLCREYRPHLESKGFRFAPAEVADRFSIEAAYSVRDRQYSGQFGFHGYNVDYLSADLDHIPTPPSKQASKYQSKNVGWKKNAPVR